MTEESSDSATNHVEMEVDKLQVPDQPSQELTNDKETNNHTAVASSGEKSKTNDHLVTDSGDQMEDSGGRRKGGEKEEVVPKEDGDGETAAGGSSEQNKGAGGDTSGVKPPKPPPLPEEVDKKEKKKSKEDGDEDEAVENEMEEITRRNRRRREVVDSSDTESDVERADDDETEKKSEPELSSDFEDELLSKPLPKPKWHAIPQLRARELGTPKNRQDFCNGAIGSVHLVSRFEKYCELKKHEGCVNTLHFNQGGNLLASGSDDLEVVLWDWAKQKPVLAYESGHRSNVFQVRNFFVIFTLWSGWGNGWKVKLRFGLDRGCVSGIDNLEVVLWGWAFRETEARSCL